MSIMRDSKTAEIKKALEQALSSSKNQADLVDVVMSTLDKQKLLRYHAEGEISLLSTAGRVLVALFEDPTMTQRALSVYLDLSETMIDKTIKSLISREIITKTKYNRQNIYRINIDQVKNHPDIQHFSAVISDISNFHNVMSGISAELKKTEVVDEPPF